MVPEQLQQLPVSLGLKVKEAVRMKMIRRRRRRRQRRTSYLRALQELQVTFTHPGEGQADRSKDCDWTRKVQD